MIEGDAGGGTSATGCDIGSAVLDVSMRDSTPSISRNYPGYRHPSARITPPEHPGMVVSLRRGGCATGVGARRLPAG